jgi:hypothetical protein
MKITDLEHGDVVSIERNVSAPEIDDVSASPQQSASNTTETAPVLATVRDITVIAETVSLRRADTGEILTDVAVEALRPAPAATDEEDTLFGNTTNESDN